MGKRNMISGIWVFIAIVAAADVYVTWAFRSSVLEWEANPIAALLFSWWGPLGIVLYRVGWLAFAKVMSRTHSRLSWLVTPLWGLGHLYLLIALIEAYPALGLLQRACEVQEAAEIVASESAGALKALDTAPWCKSPIHPNSHCLLVCAFQPNHTQVQGYLINGQAAKPRAAPRRCRAMRLGLWD